MLCVIVALYLIPALSQAYSINVHGKVEFGYQLIHLFKELFSDVLSKKHYTPKLIHVGPFPKETQTQIYSAANNANQKGNKDIKVYSVESNKPKDVEKNSIYLEYNAKPKEIQEYGIAVRETSETPVLDLIIGKKDNEKVHVYGKHEKDEVKQLRPLNNVNV